MECRWWMRDEESRDDLERERERQIFRFRETEERIFTLELEN